MKILFKLLQIIFILVLTANSVFAVDPTFNMTVRNISTTNNVTGLEMKDTITFEVWLKWTNYGVSNRFEFAAAQYTWICNRAILNSHSGLKLDLLPGSTNNPLPAYYRPPTFQVDSLSAPTGQLYLNGSGNGLNSALPPFIVSASGSYGSKILTFRLVNLSHQIFQLTPINLRFKLGEAPSTFLAYFTPVTVPDTESAPPQLAISLLDTVANQYSVENSNMTIGTYIKINLTTIFEGKYNSTYNLMSKKDTVSLYLRKASPPFDIVDSSKEVIDSVNFSNVFSFFNTLSGNYYLVVKHYQCIETWSKAGGENIIRDTSNFNYNFTTSASQAFHNNMKLKNTKYCLYSGDVDQNGSINLTDVLLIYNDASNFVNGNVVNDLNGDYVVDLSDLLVASANKNSFIRVWTP